MLKQCLTLLKHAMMLKQCLTLLKHSKTVVNTVWLKSEAIQPFFCNHRKCLQNSPKCSSNLWHPAKYSIKEMSELWAIGQEPCEPISLSRTRSELWARVQEPCELISLSRTRCELWARGQEPCELISLSRTRSELWARVQEPFEPSLSRMWALSWEIGSQDPCSARYAVTA